MTKRYTRRQKRIIEERLAYGNLDGFMCTDLEAGSVGPDKEEFFQPEDNPTRFPAEAEKIIQRQKSNAYIVLGKDRMGDIYSGFGGKGTPNSNAIDLVAGMGSSFEPLGKMYLTKEHVIDPNPFTDAARVYISQRTDLDGSFGVTEGEIYSLDSKQGVSGIAMKADSILVLGRRNIKIKAGQSRAKGFVRGGETDAHGTRLPDAKIELIADGVLEPLVKGEKMLECVTGIYREIQSNRLQMMAIIGQIAQLRLVMAFHTHTVAGVGIAVAAPSAAIISDTYDKMPDLLDDLTKNLSKMFNQTIEEINCTLVPNKDKYILSKNVWTS